MSEEIKKELEEKAEAAEAAAAEAANEAAEAEAVGAAEEVIEGAKEAAAEKAEEAAEAEAAVEAEVQAEAAEAANEVAELESIGASEDVIEAAKEAAEEKAEEVTDAAVEIVEEGAEPTTPELKPAVKPERVIKKKGLSTGGIIGIIVGGVVVLCGLVALVLFVILPMFGVEVFPKMPGKFTLGDYSKIEVLNSAVEVPESLIDSNIASALSANVTSEPVYEGVVEEGDDIHIVYTGRLKENDEEFDGGATGDAGTNIIVGSSGYIDGFDSQLVGKNVGDEFEIEVKFPEDYQSENLAGKDAIFKIKVEYKNVSKTPELTDAWAQEYAANNIDDAEIEINTVEQLKDYIYNKIYQSKLNQAIVDYMLSILTVESYDEELEMQLIEYSATNLNYYASMYGVDADSLVMYSGYNSALEYETEEAEYYMQHDMIFSKVMQDKHLSISDEEMDAQLQTYLDESGYGDQYTLQEFKDTVGETWLYVYKVMEVKAGVALEALKENVVFVDELTNPPTEETTAVDESVPAEIAE